MAASTSKRYPPELVNEQSGWSLRSPVIMSRSGRDERGRPAARIGSAETVRKWVRQVEVDAGQRPGATTEESAELKRLRRENAELKRPTGSSRQHRLSSRPSSTGHTTDRGVHPHPPRPPRSGRLVWGVEPICSVLTEHGLPIAPSTYYDHLGWHPTRRHLREKQLEADIARVHAAHYGVYGARKVWLQLNREGVRSLGARSSV